jgi:hypothetical protein
MLIKLIVLLFSFAVYAQSPDQPVKESSTDLRNQLAIFQIEDVKSGKTFVLFRTNQLEHYLRLKNDKEETLRKVDTKDAKKLDSDFASRFLKSQYEIPSEKGDCKVTLRLIMKGEEQDLCEKDEKKTQEVAPFVDELSRRF